MNYRYRVGAGDETGFGSKRLQVQTTGHEKLPIFSISRGTVPLSGPSLPQPAEPSSPALGPGCTAAAFALSPARTGCRLPCCCLLCCCCCYSPSIVRFVAATAAGSGVELRERSDSATASSLAAPRSAFAADQDSQQRCHLAFGLCQFSTEIWQHALDPVAAASTTSSRCRVQPTLVACGVVLLRLFCPHCRRCDGMMVMNLVSHSCPARCHR